MMVSVRSTLSAGITAGLVAATACTAALTPVVPAAPTAVSYSAVQLSAAIAPLLQPVPPAAASITAPPTPIQPAPGGSAGDRIINSYNAIQPWVQYGFELSAWALGWLPWPIGLAGPQINILYNSWEPITQAVVYSLAYLVDGMPDLVGPTLANGVQTGINNLVQGEVGWIAGFFPPLPPWPGAATKAVPLVAAAKPAATVTEAAPVQTTAAIDTPAPVETASPADSPTPVAQPVRRGSKRAHATVPAPVPAPAAAAAETAPSSDAPAKAAKAQRSAEPKAGGGAKTRRGAR